MMIGTGTNSTATTIAQTKLAEEHGADSALVIIPYYNRPTQNGIFLHFEAVAKSTKLPIMIYNCPGRCGQNISLETIKRLFKIPNIVGIKEASGSISQISDTIALANEFRPDFTILSGDDSLTLPTITLGGHGIISVVSNLLPKEIVKLTRALQNGDFKEAQQLNFELLPIFRAAFIETNPAPIKAAMNFHCLPAGPCRLPLAPLEEANAKKLTEVLSR
jgi:4-hydroxy-tetrahydrodipicolinate synthase